MPEDWKTRVRTILHTFAIYVIQLVEKLEEHVMNVHVNVLSNDSE